MFLTVLKVGSLINIRVPVWLCNWWVPSCWFRGLCSWCVLMWPKAKRTCSLTCFYKTLIKRAGIRSPCSWPFYFPKTPRPHSMTLRIWFHHMAFWETNTPSITGSLGGVRLVVPFTQETDFLFLPWLKTDPGKHNVTTSLRGKRRHCLKRSIGIMEQWRNRTDNPWKIWSRFILACDFSAEG